MNTLMASLKTLVEIDDELLKESSEIDHDIEEFYRNIHLELIKIPLSDLDPETLRNIAYVCKSTESFSSDWELIAYPLISNDKKWRTIAEIKACAEVHKELPLYYALKSKFVMENQNIGKLIEVLLSHNLLHVLSEIKPAIEALLEAFRRGKAKNQSLKNGTKELSKNIYCAFENESDCIKSVVETKCAFPSTAKSDLISNKFSTKPLCLSEGTLDIPHMVPKSFRMTVFIPHTDESSKIARNFSLKLKEQYDVDARAMCEIEHLLSINSRILDRILSSMDFILPIISPDYLNNLITWSSNVTCKHPCDNFRKNCYIYQYLCNEYEMNGCFNFRCRSVITSDTNAMQVMGFPLLYPCYELSQPEKLVTQLCLTKETIKRWHRRC